MNIKNIRIYYGSGININNYTNYNSEKIDIPHCLEKQFSQGFEYEDVFYELDITEELRNKILYFNGASYKTKIFFETNQILENEGVWNGFGLPIEPEYVGNKIVIQLQRYNFNLESDYHFRKLLMGFVPDVGMPFSGIYRELEVIDNLFEKQLSYKTFKNKIIIDDPSISVEVDGNQIHQVGNTVTVENVDYWTPTNPQTYNVTFRKDKYKKVENVAFVDFETKENKVYFNQSKFYMKGILHWGYYPQNISPILSVEDAEEEILKIKNAGFNTIKLCLFMAPEYYYDLCLKHGMVIWQEFPLWLPPKSEIVNKRIINEFPKYINMVKKFSNITHVSIGCELEGTISQEILDNLYFQVKEEFPSKLVCDNSGSNECFSGVSNITTDFYDYHFYGELDNFSTLVDKFTEEYRYDKPWYFGEFCDADTWRDNRKYYEEWWTSEDENINLLHQVHKGFASGTNVRDQERLTKGLDLNHNKLTADSVDQAFDFRKKIFEKLRLKETISGYNITTIRNVGITTSGIFDDEMNLKFKCIKDAISDQNTVLMPPLRRKWISGGDIFEKRDLSNIICGEPFEAKLLYSNLTEEEITSEIIIELNNKEISKYNIDSNKYLTQVADVYIDQYQSGINQLKIITRNKNGEYVNIHEFVAVEKPDIDIKITKDMNFEDLENPVLYVIESSNSEFDVIEGPFYREGIIYTQNKLFESTFGKLSKKAFENIAPISFLKETSQDIQPIVSRIDARKFYNGHYLWKIGTKYYTTFDIMDDTKSKQQYREKNAIKARIVKCIWEDYNDSINN